MFLFSFFCDYYFPSTGCINQLVLKWDLLEGERGGGGGGVEGGGGENGICLWGGRGEGGRGAAFTGNLITPKSKVAFSSKHSTIQP